MNIRKKAAAVAAGVAIAMFAAACGNGDAGDAATPDATPTVEPTDGAGDEGTDAPSADDCAVPESGRVGAMADFAVGTTFTATEPITVDFMYRVHPNYPIDEWNTDWNILTAMQEINNVTVDTSNSVLMADWDGTRNMEIGAGTFPTVIPVVWGGQEGGWNPEGQLLPVSEYLACMPNLANAIATWPNIETEIETRRQPDGKIYNMGSFREMPNIEHTWVINVDIFEEAGAPTEFATFDDLKAAMIQVRDADIAGLNYVLSERWNTGAGGVLGATLNFVGPNFGTAGGWNRNIHQFDWDLDEFVLRPGMSEFRDLVGFFADLRAENLLDPEITQEDDPAVANFINSRSAMIATNGGELAGTILRGAADVDIELNTKMITVPAGPAGNLIAGGQLGPGFVLNANIRENENFLAILQWLDWLYFSDEGLEFGLWGVEGRTFERDAQGVPFMVASLEDGRSVTDIFQQDFGFRDGVFMQSWGGTNANIQSGLPDVANVREWHQAMSEIKTARPIEPGASVPSGTPEGDELTLLTEAVQTEIEQGVAQFIAGARSMDEWDDFVAQVRAAGGDRIIELRNMAYRGEFAE